MAILDGRHVVITGASGGVGGAVVEAFVGAGATCHVPERKAAAGGRKNVDVVGNVDLTSEEAVVAFYRALPRLWASVHLAGGYSGAPIRKIALADLRAELDRNFVTSFLCCREAVGKMDGGGRIVNVASRAALLPAGGSIAYATAKAAVVWLTRCLAEEVKGQGILVNAVAPSTIDTPANRAAMPTADHASWLKPAELADTILWLASPVNALTSGAVIPAYGRA
jgi:NAD(P)-dependent dehydrogenase (short-subunit alcohol dehydrogenase family)